jgi:hypothetical protein
MLKMILAAGASALLWGCAGALMRVEADCQANHRGFVEMAACLKENLRQGSPSAWAYVEAAQGLATEVRSGRMSESEARSRLAALKSANTAAAMDRLGRSMEEPQRQLEEQRTRRPPRAPSMLDADAGCSSNLDCPIGTQCMRPGGYGAGVCGRPVDSYGTPTYRPDARGAVCTMDTDCPVSFECRKPNGRYEGICTKRY